MNYKLAKQLKDAGFKQPDRYPGSWEGYFEDEKGNIKKYMCTCEKECMYNVYIPTLSELKEACGDRFYQLTHSHGKSYAYGFSKNADIFNDQTDISSGESDTDEIAVAKLFIKLNDT